MRQGGPGLRLAWEVGPGRWEIARRHSNPLRAETFFVPLSSVRVFEVVVKRASQGPATELSNEPGMMGFWMGNGFRELELGKTGLGTTLWQASCCGSVSTRLAARLGTKLPRHSVLAKMGRT